MKKPPLASLGVIGFAGGIALGWRMNCLRPWVCAVLVLLLGVFAATFAFESEQASAQEFTLGGNALSLPVPVTFKTGAAELTSEGEQALGHVKAYLDAKSYITLLRVEVHTDSTGTEPHNQALSEQRALAVARFLVAQGVDCARLLPVGFGSNKPVADNSTAEGRAENRRVEFVNAALRGRLIGGMPADGGGQIAGDPCAR